MKRFLAAALILSSFAIRHSSVAADPLRVFIRSGPKSHAPGAHDYPQFLKDWVPLLNERGAKAEGKSGFPTKEELDRTDVLILHAQEAGNIAIGEERKNLLEFLKRGGGIVTIHAGAVSRDPGFFASVIGGSWNHERPTKWLEGPMHLYFTDRENPITKDMSNFAMDDEIYYDMDILPEARILAAAYTPKPQGTRNEKASKRAEELTGGGKKVSIYDIQPQVWTYEKDSYRAFTCIPGHWYKNFSHPTMRAMILRGIAWAGKRENADELLRPDEVGDALRYVEGGPTRPEKAAEKLEVHPEFDISLVAAEPLINKPMNVDWDEKGRLWVVETPEYPNGRRELNVEKWKDSGSWTKTYDRDPIDRISWLEDTNGDGVMDKKHVFADKLELCTSFCFYKNGVIACAAPDIWNLQDTDGDGVCDKREKLYTNLGTGDTHAVINNLRWGLDGWVYATHGYSGGTVTAVNAPAKPGVSIGSGVIRFKPDGTEIEQYASRGGNTWGLDITWDGQVFFTQPTSGTVFFHVVLPEYVLAKGKIPGTTSWKGMVSGQKSYPLMTWPEQAYVQIDQVGNFTAAAGCAIYEGGAWPEKWNYSYFTTEPTINIVHHQFVRKDGVSYTTEKEQGREETEFIRSRDLWFRPIEVRVGPDGALYVVDFYNQAVIHNDTRGPIHGPANAAVRPDRDHYFGRIWKVNHKQAKKVEVVKLDKKDHGKLFGVISSSPNAAQKKHAWRNLIENSKWYEAAASVATLVKEEGERSGPGHRLSAFVVDIFNQQRLADPNRDSRPSSDLSIQGKDINEMARNYFGSEALHGMMKDSMAAAPARQMMLAAYQKAANDGWTQSAVAAFASEAPVSYLRDCLLWDEANQASKIASTVVAGKNRGFEDIVRAVLPAAMRHEAEANTSSLIGACVEAPARSDSLKTIVLQGMAQHLNDIPTLTPALTEGLKKLLAQPALAAATLPLVMKWDKAGALKDEVAEITKRLLATVADLKATTPDRLAAAAGILEANVADGIAAVAAEIDRREGADAPFSNPAEYRRGIISLIGGSTDAYVGERLMDAYLDVEPEMKSAIFDVLMTRPEWALEVLEGIKRGMDVKEFAPGDIARLRTHPNKNVAKQANAMIEKLNPGAKAKNELIAQLTPEVEKPGDAGKGKMIFTAACAICHKLGDIGKDVAPPLVGMGAHGPAELLIHIVDPNREVDPSFWAWNITKKNGETLAGVITAENQASVNLRNQAGDFEIKKSDIATRENTRRSLMPEGLEALGAENLRDVLAFVCNTSDQKFRVLDLRDAYNADSRTGIFRGDEFKDETVTLHKFGNVTVHGVPFFVMDPEKSQTGASFVALKGGGKGTVADNFPSKVEIATNATAASLHLLGGVAGWAWPFGGDGGIGKPAMTVHVEFADGDRESIVLKNGEHFADYIGRAEVPLSDDAGDFTRRGQLRYLAFNLKKKGQLKKLTLETSGSNIAPCTVAITAGAEKVVEKSAAAAPARNPNKGGAAAKKGEGGKKAGGAATGGGIGK